MTGVPAVGPVLAAFHKGPIICWLGVGKNHFCILFVFTWFPSLFSNQSESFVSVQ